MKSCKTYHNKDIVEYYAQKENLDSNTAEIHFSAMKTFLHFASQTEKPCFPSKDLDEAWHIFILFTKEYQLFCNNYLKNFVHHVPFVNAEDKVKNFAPGYYCFIEKDKFKRKYVKSVLALETTIKANCGSGGDCSPSNCGSGNDD